MKIPKEIKYDVTKLNCSNCDFIVNKNIDIKTVKTVKTIKTIKGTITYEKCTPCFYAFLTTIINYYPANYKYIINKILKYYDDRKFYYSFPCRDSSAFNGGKTLKFIFKLLEYNYNKLEVE